MKTALRTKDQCEAQENDNEKLLEMQTELKMVAEKKRKMQQINKKVWLD